MVNCNKAAIRSGLNIPGIILCTILIYLLPLNAVSQTVLSPSATVFDRRLKEELDTTFSWFRNNPPKADGSNFRARWQKTKLLDKYGFQISNKDWNLYRSYWTTDSLKELSFENSDPILYYLRHAVDASILEIRNTTVTRGVVIWKLYNIGYVVKTKDVCFAIDLVQPRSSELVDILDFAIVSHRHGDHNDINFLNAMIAAGKKVYSPFYTAGTVIDSTREFTFGEVKVRFTMNAQADVPVIVSQINCGASADNYTIYHIADARILAGLNPTSHVNLFILHIANALDVFDAVNRVKPDVTVYDHVMELGHPVDQYRWSYDFTYNKIRNQLPSSSYVLTWGERIEAGVRTDK